MPDISWAGNLLRCGTNSCEQSPACTLPATPTLKQLIAPTQEACPFRLLSRRCCHCLLPLALPLRLPATIDHDRLVGPQELLVTTRSHNIRDLTVACATV